VATPGELCNKTAELLGLQPNTTSIAWRALREGSRVTTGGRGKSAAHCVPSDAANLLIATIGKLQLKSYLKSWERFSRLKAGRPRGRKRALNLIGEIFELKADHSFQEGLTALITSTMSGSLQKFLNHALHPGSIQVDFYGPRPEASINLLGEDVSLWLGYSDFATEILDVVQPDESGDLEQSMKISDRTIIGLAEFLRIERGSN
jgi:hypothetical protein